ncbi:tyrosine-type recombinase/integrase [uncultured Oscillibacter sp.]|uniref:tyrosine-type recombinase/integrase n=1 Tax=uncultured Oscillibacter sp. TaxID=876091 RepID=UPI00272A674B|nr:tyrosine-type recombinase/integrase [uncultured Oscillibacter sp.]
MKKHISEEKLIAFERHLRLEEREPATIEKYLRDIRSFAMWLEERALCKEAVVAWKENLLAKHYAPSTVNSMLIAVNRFFRFQHWDELRVKTVRVQRQIFRRRDKELTKEEYARLLDTAQDLGRERLALLMETICATGIRVSEVRYITVEAAQAGRAEIALKGKIRTILLPGKLRRKLLKYAKKQNTGSGEIFLTRTGKGMSRRQIWAEMKSICKKAGVAPSKVFPHNLRHLFARTFYKVCRDVVQLADVLGHSSVETTRIYLATTGDEYVRRMDRLGLIS